MLLNYTGHRGLHASLTLDDVYKRNIKRVIARTRPPAPIFVDTDYHVTVMHSRQAPEPNAVIECVKRCTFPITIKPVGVEHWTGPSGTGYVVLQLHDQDLRCVHQAFNDCGAIHVFPAFIPHLTVCKTALNEKTSKWMERLTEVVEKETLVLNLNDISISDLKNW